MKIEALIFDLDGTAIPNRPDGMPSSRVVEAVSAAKKICPVSVATGRPYEMCKPILDALQIEEICIVNGGTTLYSRKDNQVLWRQEIAAPTVKMLLDKLQPFSYYTMADEKWTQEVPMLEYKPIGDVGMPVIFAVMKEDLEPIFQAISEVPGIIAHSVNSWKKGFFDIHIIHELATKKHALISLLARMNIDRSKTMVVGDGGNDMPLFEVAGWKVAMGNAADELKAAADWVAPSVDEDGLAVAIEKFVLSDNEEM